MGNENVKYALKARYTVANICDEKIFDSVPVKKEVKAVISGMYITEVRGARGPLPVAEGKGKKKAKKKGRYARFVERMQEKAGAKPLK